MGAAAFSVYAVPAYRGAVTITQPDGSKLEVIKSGDEFTKSVRTVDGFLLAEVDGIYHYAMAAGDRIVASDIVARNAAERTSAETDFISRINNAELERLLTKQNAAPRRTPGLGLFPGTSFPATGSPKALVVLVQYQDEKFTLADPYDYFSKLLNEKGFSDYDATGSVSDYFADNSDGLFTPQFDLFGPLTLKQDVKYYGGNTAGGSDRRAYEMIIEACEMLDATVDLSEYDTDGDGYIDNVFVFYAGKGENADGDANTVWPHSANVTDYAGIRKFDGVTLRRYACTNEWRSGRPDGVGTFIHEFSHVMGLPDLYATTYSGSFTPGPWSVLDYGPYNNNGCTPPRYSVFERNALGWVEPTPITEADDVFLRPGDTRVIPTDKTNEFFLLENRRQTGWDAYTPGHGMLIWHVDYNASVWTYNAVNNTPTHQYVDLEEADCVQSEYTRDADCFPGMANVSTFTDTTRPSMRTWAGKSLGLPLTQIAESDEGVISFRVAGGLPVPDKVTGLTATDITPVSFTARWEESPRARQYFVTVSCDGKPIDRLTDVVVYDACSLEVEGLEWETAYSYTVRAANGTGTAETSEPYAVTTAKATFEYMYPVAQVADVSEYGFALAWTSVPEADSYVLDVYTKHRGKPRTETCDFTNGISALAGWATDSKSTYSLTSYVGKSAPSLRLNSNYIDTPPMSDDIHSIRFWHRGNNAPAENTLDIIATDAKGTKTVVAQLPITNSIGGETVSVDALPSKTRQIRIMHNRPASGAVAIDDIVLNWGGEFSLEPAAGYDGLNVGYKHTHQVDGLYSGTTYFCKVTALSGSRTSLASEEIEVTTGGQNSVEDIIVDGGVKVDVEGRKVTVTADEATSISIADLTGRLLASTVGADLTVSLPAPGIYIIATPTHRQKVLVR